MSEECIGTLQQRWTKHARHDKQNTTEQNKICNYKQVMFENLYLLQASYIVLRGPSKQVLEMKTRRTYNGRIRSRRTSTSCSFGTYISGLFAALFSRRLLWQPRTSLRLSPYPEPQKHTRHQNPARMRKEILSSSSQSLV